MKKKLIITESQLNRLRVKLNEENQHARTVKQIKDILDSTYEPIEKYVRKGGEYSNSAMVKNKIDDEEITIAQLFKYLKHSSGLSEENAPLIKQAIKDWMFGNIGDDYTLSKNVPLK
jgi:hypothetical protein